MPLLSFSSNTHYHIFALSTRLSHVSYPTPHVTYPTFSYPIPPPQPQGLAGLGLGDDTGPSGPYNSSGSSGPSGPGWGKALSSVWAKATEATSDMVKDLTKPQSDDDFKFPRPPTAAERQASLQSQQSVQSLQTQGLGRGSSGSLGQASERSERSMGVSSTATVGGTSSSKSLAKRDEWDDDEEEVGIGHRPSKPASHSRVSSISSEVFEDLLGNGSGSGSGGNNNGSNNGSNSGNNGSMSGKVSAKGMSLPPPAPAALGPRTTSNASVASAGSAGSGSSAAKTSAKTAAAPSGDDFFATFGV